MARPNFVEKTFADGSKTVKFVNVFSLESFALYDNLVGGVIGCQVSNFSTAVCLVHCLQEELSFLCLVREILLQHIMNTMLISSSVRF